MSRRVFFYDDLDLAARQNLNLVRGPVNKLGVAEMEERARSEAARHRGETVLRLGTCMLHISHCRVMECLHV